MADRGFGIRTPSLIEQLRAVLDQYPDDGQILKELIQNAEDAGAKSVKFVNDRRQFSAKSLYQPDLKIFQGPALYAYNDAVFGDADWDRIGAIHNSSKKDDPLKVGKFGLGFKSVFHMTDLPSVISGDKIGFLDPHEKFFGLRTTGKQWHLENDEEEISSLPDQFEPFVGIFGGRDITFSGEVYKGTLFRFPLRTGLQDPSQFCSQLSEQIYASEKIDSLFRSFMTCAYMNLLFLSSLESIELYERTEGSEKPELIFRLALHKKCIKGVRSKRREFLSEIAKVRQTNEWPEKPIQSTYELQFTETTYIHQSAASTPPPSKKAKKSVDKTSKTTKWMLTNHFSGGQVSLQFKELANDSKLGYLPWVAVAMCCSTKDEPFQQVKQKPQQPKGHFFCFLPLPLEEKSVTGLPVHISGFFALSQNRRQLKWLTADQDRSALTDKALLWNIYLVEEAVSVAYAELLNCAILAGFSPMCVYNAMPDCSLTDPKFEKMVTLMYRVTLRRQSFYSPTTDTSFSASKWHNASEVLFNDLSPNIDNVEDLVNVLMQSGEKICTVLSHVEEALQKHEMKITKIQPGDVRTALKKPNVSTWVDSLSFDKKMSILKYILSDSSYGDIIDIKLLPRCDQVFVSFQSSASNAVYIPTKDHPKDLLPGLTHSLLETERVPSEVATHLEKMATLGLTQLKMLDKTSMAELIRRLFDPCRDNTKDWDPQTTNHPTHGWLQMAWEYLTRQFPDNLSWFEDLHILIDLSSCRIVKLSSGLPALITFWQGDRLDDGLAKWLKALGVIVFKNLPKFIEDHHAVVPKYISPPTPEGVLQALSNVQTQTNLEKIKEWPLAEKDKLRKLVSEASAQDIKSHKELLMELPIFMSVGGTEYSHPQSSGNRVSLHEAPWALHQSPRFSLRWKFIDASGTDSEMLVQQLGMRILDTNDLLREIVLADIEWYKESGEIDLLMKQVLTINMNEDKEIRHMVRDIPFVPNESGERFTASQLFDHHDSVVFDLYHGVCDIFPTGQYKDDTQLHAALKRLGLKTEREQITAKDIYKAAEYVQNVSAEGSASQNVLIDKSEAIMTILRSRPTVLKNRLGNGNTLSSCLKRTRFIKVKPRQENYPISLPWCSSNCTFLSPSELCSSIYENMIGSVQHVSDEVVDEEIAREFGWNERPTLSKVIAQLEQVVSHYTSKEKGLFLPMILDIYGELFHPVRGDVPYDGLKSSSQKWIWNGDGFSSSKDVVPGIPPELQGIQLHPHLFVLPKEVEQFSEQFSQYGVEPKDKLEIILQVQSNIQIKYQQEERVQSQITNSNAADLDAQRDLQTIIDLLHIVESMDEVTISQLPDKLLVPVHSDNKSTLILKPVSQCTYCDMDWLQQGYDVTDINDEETESIFFVHEHVSMQTSEKLGVPTLMSRILDVEELDMNYGQSEPLTCRLHNLLKEGYTDGLSVPKELIQNADDAGAQEVKFLYDQRRNEDAQTCLIDEGMRSCQGPALWAYNDAVFTEEDFKNLVQLGGATKEKMSDKIGKFGLGFNAVYNLTDVPSFVSSNSIAIFDPHMKHLGRAARSKPGIKIILKNRKKLQKLKNQFKPFNGIFGCNLDSTAKSCMFSYNATLFRFPLRTKEQSYKSEISDVHYDEKQVLLLLQKLVDSSSEVLLFTQNVKKISIYHLPKDGTPSMIQCIYETTKNISKVIRGLHLPELQPTQILKASTQALQSAESVPSIPMPKDTQKPSVSLLLEMSSKMDAGSVSIIKTEERNDFWLVTSCMGDLTSQMLTMCKSSGLVPTGGVAVHLKECSVKGSVRYAPLCTQKGTFFCYLPLPISSGFSFHVNGSFSVESNRKHLTEKTTDDKVSKGAEWNQIIMKDVIPKALLFCLEDLRELTCGTPYSFSELWPTCGSTYKPVCEPLVQQFYASLFSTEEQQAPALFSNGKIWENVHNVGMLTEDVKGSDIVTHAERILEDYLQKRGKIYVKVPSEIMETMLSFAPGEIQGKIMFDLLRLYNEAVFPNINTLDGDVRDALILYAIDQDDEYLNKLLQRYPCIPSIPHGELKKPCALMHPNSRATPLYHEEDGIFIKGTKRCYLNSCRLRVLNKLGIFKDISCEQILERAKSVAGLHQTDNARGVERVKEILQYLDWRLSKKEGSKLKSELSGVLREVPFLPVKPKPDGYPLPWKGKHNNIAAPKECFSTDVETLVSSTAAVIDRRELKMKGSVEMLLKIKSRRDVELDQVWDQFDEAIAAAPKCGKFEKLKDIMKDIYQFLNYILQREPAQQFAISNAPQGRSAVYIPQSQEFVSGSKVIFNSKDRFEPLLFGCPYDWRDFPDVMEAAGVREDFDIADYIMALQKPHQTYSKKSLPSYIRQIVSALQQKIENEVKSEQVPLTTKLKSIEDKNGPIYLPDEDGVMSEAKGLYFDDCSWLENDDDDMHCAHKDFPFHEAKGLGVQTKRGEKLRKCSMGIPFGQKEKLTNRIKRILEGYPCDQDILKELLQNADDAKATEVHFVLDLRDHSTERIFEDCWKPLQGPALCVYNNSPFTQADIEGISNLGEGSKSEDPNKTGQYGVGFNAVYHLTDAPSFLTKGKEIGETLCVFDPHCIYVPGASFAEPGRRYDDIPKLRKSFPDIFASYLDNMRESFPMEEATLFRLPLRIKHMAKQSKIKTTPVTIPEMQSLMATFRGNLFLMMLFLNNIRKISVSEINMDTGELQDTYSVEAHLSDEDAHAQQSFLQDMVNSSGRLKTQKLTVEQLHPINVSFTMSLEDNKGRLETWLITQQFGFSNPSSISTTLKKALRDRELGLLPRGGVAHLLPPDSLPTEKLDLPKGRLFCFLPLPLITNLPVHINGHFALDHEARRNLWMNTENTDVKTEWNNTLIEQTVAPCYTNMLQQTKMIIMKEMSGGDETQIRRSLSQYCELFPDIQHQENYIRYLSQKVYQLTSELHLRVLPVLRHARVSEKGFKVAWFSPTGSGKDGVFFDDLDTQIQEPGSGFRDTSKCQEPSSREIVRRILCESNFNLLYCPMSIYINYRDAEIQVKTVSPEAVLCFFQTYQRPDSLCFISCSDLPEDIEKTIFGNVGKLRTMLRFCKKSAYFVQLLEGSPLLVTEDNKLRMFSSRTPVFCSPFWDLLPLYAASFCHRSLECTIFRTDQERSIFKKFQVSDLAERLPFALPEVLQNGGIIQWDLKAPSKKWIQLLWTYLHSEVGAVSDGNKIISLLKPLSHWCLLPVTVGKSTCLLQVSRTREVMDNRDFFHHFLKTEVLGILQKLGVPQLAYDILQQPSEKTALQGSGETIRAIIGHPRDPSSMIIALEGVAKQHKLAGRLNVSECHDILGYFCQYLHVLESNPELKQKLCTLPFFLSAKEEIISIEGKNTYIAPSSIPLDGMQLLEGGGKHLAFLKPYGTLQPLYTWLGCRVLSECDMYCDFILPRFEILSEEERIKHLQFIAVKLRHRIGEDKWERLIDKLSHMKFLPDSRSGIPGTLSTASAFYDSYNEVFKAMLTEKDFPSEPFRSQPILCLMREIGLQHQVTSEKLIEFAKAIERGAILAWKSRNKAELKKREKQAHVLVIHLFSRKDVGHLLPIMKDVAFLPRHVASSNLQRLCPCGNMDGETVRPFICFNGAVSYKQEYEHLSWTSVSFLEQWAEPRDRKLCEILGVKEIPSLEQVIDHCCNVCHYLQEQVKDLTSEESELLSETMGQIYQHLERYKNKVKENPKWTQKLQHLTCILVEDGKRFVYPSQVATSCLEEEEIKPYLFAVPSHFASCLELFKLIGSTDRPSCCQYATVLEMIHKDTEGEKLEPNEKKKALKAMGFLFKNLHRGEEWPEQVKLLYLLTSAGELRQSKDIIFIDNMSHFDRLQKFPLEEPMLARPSMEEFGPEASSYSDVAECLPECLRLRYLTDVVKEKLHSEPSINILQEHPLKWKIESEVFYQAVMRLCRHAGKTQGFTVSKQDRDELQENIKNIKLHFVTELTTVLEYKGEVLSGSEKTQSSFYQKAHCGQQSHCFYLKGNFQMCNFSPRFVEILNSLSKGRLSTSLHHMCHILDKKIDEISRYLDDQDIPPDDYCSDTSVLPTPGTYLHIEDQHLLSENFHHFECGEYVGYEVEDPLLKSLEGLPIYIYAIVLEEIKEDADSQTSDVLRRYKIRIGSEEEDVLVVTANDLYKFKRTAKVNSKDVVLYDKTPTEDDFTPTCLEDIKEDITKTLEAAWKLDENERKKVIKRLLRKYHPDKNLGQEDICNEACKFIQTEIARLERGPQETSTGPRWSHTAYEDVFEHFYTKMGHRASQEREFHERYYSRESHGSDSRTYGGFWETRKNPQPYEASRWFRQAQWDFKAVSNDTREPFQSYEWACFKCHQSAEKALKAAQFAINANLKCNSHDLPTMAATLNLADNCSTISLLSRRLQSLLTHSTAMRYPDRCRGLPHEVFNMDTATQAVDITSQLLTEIKTLLTEKGVPMDRTM